MDRAGMRMNVGGMYRHGWCEGARALSTVWYVWCVCYTRCMYVLQRVLDRHVGLYEDYEDYENHVD